MVQRTTLVINTEEKEWDWTFTAPSHLQPSFADPTVQNQNNHLGFFPFQLGDCGSIHVWIKDLTLHYNSFPVENTAKIQRDDEVQLNWARVCDYSVQLRTSLHSWLLLFAFSSQNTNCLVLVVQAGSSQSPVPSHCARVPGEGEEAKEEGALQNLWEYPYWLSEELNMTKDTKCLILVGFPHPSAHGFLGVIYWKGQLQRAWLWLRKLLIKAQISGCSSTAVFPEWDQK